MTSIAETDSTMHAHFEGCDYDISYIGSLPPVDESDDTGWLSLELDLPAGLTGDLALEFWDRIGEWTIDLNVSEAESHDVETLVTALRYAQRLRDHMNALGSAPFLKRIRDEFAAEVAR